MAAIDQLIIELKAEGADDAAADLQKLSDGFNDLKAEQDKATQSTIDATKADKQHTMGLADLKAGLDIAGKALGTIKDFLVDAVKETVAYAETTRDLSRAIGSTAEEASTLIQVADDVKVSTGTLEAAFKAAIKNGIRPSIDNLAKLSDEYLAIQDPVARSQFAMEKFGRAGLEMGKLLEMGSDAIRESAKEAKNLGLVLDDKAVKAARELEVALDGLGDRAEAVKTKIAKGLIPVANDLLSVADKVFTNMDQRGVAFDDAADAAERVKAIDYVLANDVWPWEIEQLKRIREEKQKQAETDELLTLTGDELIQRQRAEAAVVNQTVSAGADLIEYLQAEETGMRNSAQAADENAAATKRKAEADRIAQQAAADAAIAYENTAQSLVNAQKLSDYAKVALGGLDQQLKDGQISASQYQAAFATLGIDAGIVSTQSLAATRGIEAINKAFANGQINAEQYSDAVAKLPQAAKDGVVTLEEVGIKTTGAIKKSKQDLLDETDGAITQTVSKTSDTISKSMLSVSNATTAAKGVVKTLKDEVLSLPEYRKIVLEIEVKGQVPKIPGRAGGGPVSAGMPYIVGERGPEMIVPSHSGTVIPNSNSYSTTYNITTDRHGMAYLFERQRMAEMRM